MSKKRITYIHIFIWLFAIFANLPYSNFHQGMEPSQLVASTIGFLYLMVVFYLFYLVMVPRFLNRKKIAEFFAFSFIVVLVMPFFGYTFLFLSRAFFEGTFQNFYRDYSLRMNQKAELDRQNLAVELDLLKSKLNPHFLFNTLNNIDSLIHHDPEEASAALIRLSDIMRYLTYETASDVVDLKR